MKPFFVVQKIFFFASQSSARIVSIKKVSAASRREILQIAASSLDMPRQQIGIVGVKFRRDGNIPWPRTKRPIIKPSEAALEPVQPRRAESLIVFTRILDWHSALVDEG